MKKLRTYRTYATYCLIFMTIGCADLKKLDGPTGKPTSSVLVSSAFKALALAPLAQSSASILSNVSGLADSLLINQTGSDNCGFVAWAADSQIGAVGTEGRSYEAFDLGTPADWTSTGHGLGGRCDGGPLGNDGSAFFMYVDFHIKTGSETDTLRVYAGDSGVYKAGDILLQEKGSFSWLDTETNALVAADAERPKLPKQASTLAGSVPWFDDGGGEDGNEQTKMIIKELRFRISNPGSVDLNNEIVKTVIDFDFSAIDLSGFDRTDSATKISTLNVANIFDNSGEYPISAKVTALSKDQVGSSDDPEPSKANNVATPEPM